MSETTPVELMLREKTRSNQLFLAELTRRWKSFPVLLAACERMLAFAGGACEVAGYPHTPETCSACAARAAIAKAKGE